MAAAPCISALLLLLLLPYNPALAGKSWNINCGASEGFTDNKTGISWVGDGEYVRVGETHGLPGDNVTAESPQLAKLRAFPKSKKSCYTIPVAANTRIRVQVSLYYGNYDGRSMPPSFRLMFDATDWGKITTKTNQTVRMSVIYVTGRDHTSICLWRLNDDEVPFVSSIQVWTMDPRMYSKVDSNVSLWGPTRYAFGADEPVIRSPDDSYDRYWYRITSSEQRIFKNDATNINTSTSADDPPAKLFRNAIVANSTMQNLTIQMFFVRGTKEMYINMYFSEMYFLNATEKRAFHVYIYDGDDDKDGPLISPPPLIAPLFGSALEFSYIIPEATKTTRLTLFATTDSTLPPIISGFESLFTWPFSSRETDDKDVLALSWLQGNFTMLSNWTGDPCLPLKYGWDWVRCNTDATPHIIKLYLGDSGLSGQIPDFSAMDELISIEMQYNNLDGSIPEFLSKFPKLQVLNLAYNDFSSIPLALTKSTTILLNVTGNPKLCDADKICLYSPYTQNVTSAPPPPPPPPPYGSSKRTAPSVLHLLTILAIIVMISM